MKKRKLVSILLAMTLSFSMVAAPAGMVSAVAAEVDGITADEGFGTGAEADSGDDAVIAEASEELFEELGDTDESFEEDVPEEIQNEIDGDQELGESASDENPEDEADAQDATEETAGDVVLENQDEAVEADEAEAGEAEAGEAETGEAASESDAVNAEADADVVEEAIVEDVSEPAQEEVSKDAKDGTIPQETLTMTCGQMSGIFEIDHDADTSVSLEFVSEFGFGMDYQTDDYVSSFTTNTARFEFFAYSAGEGIIKAIESGTGRVLKIFNVTISPGTETITVNKGGYVWTTPPASLASLSFTESEGVSITKRSDRNFEYYWGVGDPEVPTFIVLTEGQYAVKGEELGDYTVSFYEQSEDNPYYIVTYHVVEGGDEPPIDPQAEETITLSCGSVGTSFSIDYYAESSVYYDVDPELEISYWTEDVISGYETNTETCYLFAYGAGTGAILAKDRATDEVLKTVHLVITPYSGVVTNCKGNINTEMFTTMSDMQWTASDGINIELTNVYDNYTVWSNTDPSAANLMGLRDYEFEVTGEETGDYTVTFYVNSVDKPYCITTYHIIDHSFTIETVIKEATCAEDGILGKECANCRETITEPIPATNNHTWNTEYTVDTEPTYDTEGSESIHCSVCDIVKEGSERAVPRLPKPVSALAISGVENKVYDGQEVTLNLVVIDDETVLEEGVDYTVSYSNNSYVGKAQVTVTGIGHYEGSVSRQFLILPGAPAKVTCKNLADGIKISWEKVEGATSYYVYRDDKLLFRESRLERLDREVKYECGKKYTYRVIATTKDVGNSTRSRTCKMFRLMPVKITKLSNPSAGKLKVEYDKSPGCYGYVVRYGLKSDMSDASVVSVKGENTLSRVFNGAKKGKTYYVQVRTYMLEFGLRYYSGYCTTQKITIKK